MSSSTWNNKQQTAIDRERASQRLDCFLSVVYLFPNCLEPKDMDLLTKREQELTKITQYAGQGFFCLYLTGLVGNFALRRGMTPYFRDVVKHSILLCAGSFIAGRSTEKIAAEFYYNRILIQLADKYNFTPEEVMDLQRNLNQYYIQKERDNDLKRL